MDVRRVVAAVRRRVFSAAAGATLVALFMASREVVATGTCERLRGLTSAVVPAGERTRLDEIGRGEEREVWVAFARPRLADGQETVGGVGRVAP